MVGVDGFVQVAVDGAGKKVDNTEITRPDAVVVERQRVEPHDDDDNVLSTAAIVAELKTTNELLFRILLQLEVTGGLPPAEG